MKPGDVVRATDDDPVEFECPFCKRRCLYTTTDSMGDVVSHALPACPTYNANDGTGYLYACLKEMKKHAPN